MSSGSEHKGLIVWKDEGGQGPVTYYTPDARPAEHPRIPGHFIFPLREYGAPEPEGVTTRTEWKSKAEARRIAEKLGADFYEA